MILALTFVFLLAIKSESVHNWRITRELKATTDPSRRIALLNLTRPYPTNYWNDEYLKECARANSEMEQRFLADLIQERLGSNGIPQLRAFATVSTNAAAKSNLLSVLSLLRTK